MSETPLRSLQPTPLRSLHAQAKTWAEISGLMLVIGFVASIAVNTLVFERWGLSFLQLASTTDVVMSGLHFAGPIALFGLIILGVLEVASSLRKWTHGERLDRETEYISYNLALIGVSLGAPRLSFINPFAEEPATAAAIVGGALALIAIRYLADPLVEVVDGWRLWIKRTAVPALLVVFAMQSVTLFSLRVEQGFFPSYVRAQDSASLGCAGDARLLWSGSDAIVARCSEAITEQRRVIIQRSPDLSFAVDRRITLSCSRAPWRLMGRCRLEHAP